jgi:hypothetical protein
MKIQDIWVFGQDPGFSGYVQDIGIHESSAIFTVDADLMGIYGCQLRICVGAMKYPLKF